MNSVSSQAFSDHIQQIVRSLSAPLVLLTCTVHCAVGFQLCARNQPLFLMIPRSQGCWRGEYITCRTVWTCTNATLRGIPACSHHALCIRTLSYMSRKKKYGWFSHCNKIVRVLKGVTTSIRCYDCISAAPFSQRILGQSWWQVIGSGFVDVRIRPGPVDLSLYNSCISYYCIVLFSLAL